MSTTRSPGSRRFLLVGFALFAGATQALAQTQTGAIRGTVTDRATGMPISAARVQVVGRENAAANTDDRGTYLIRNLPPGQQGVRVTRLGYRPEVQQATITGTDTVTVNFGLGQSAVELQQVVVTGTGGAVEKRKIGASLGTVDVAQQQELMPSTSFSQVLAAKVTGVRSTMTGGGVGSGQDLRIRGMASFSPTSAPSSTSTAYGSIRAARSGRSAASPAARLPAARRRIASAISIRMTSSGSRSSRARPRPRSTVPRPPTASSRSSPRRVAAKAAHSGASASAPASTGSARISQPRPSRASPAPRDSGRRMPTT